MRSIAAVDEHLAQRGHDAVVGEVLPPEELLEELAGRCWVDVHDARIRRKPVGRVSLTAVCQSGEQPSRLAPLGLLALRKDLLECIEDQFFLKFRVHPSHVRDAHEPAADTAQILHNTASPPLSRRKKSTKSVEPRGVEPPTSRVRF